MIASSHPKHRAPVEEASINRQDYAEELTMHIVPERRHDTHPERPTRHNPGLGIVPVIQSSE
jgi:hypothetical protein